MSLVCAARGAAGGLIPLYPIHTPQLNSGPAPGNPEPCGMQPGASHWLMGGEEEI